jgi:hypothetical protein
MCIYQSKISIKGLFFELPTADWHIFNTEVARAFRKMMNINNGAMAAVAKKFKTAPAEVLSTGRFIGRIVNLPWPNSTQNKSAT